MGVYYFFYNVTRKQSNELPIKGHGDCTFVAKFNSLSEDYIIQVFNNVITDNNWANTDIIHAYPDNHYCPSVKYINDIIEYEANEDSDLMIPC